MRGLGEQAILNLPQLPNAKCPGAADAGGELGGDHVSIPKLRGSVEARLRTAAPHTPTGSCTRMTGRRALASQPDVTPTVRSWRCLSRSIPRLWPEIGCDVLETVMGRGPVERRLIRPSRLGRAVASATSQAAALAASVGVGRRFDLYIKSLEQASIARADYRRGQHSDQR